MKRMFTDKETQKTSGNEGHTTSSRVVDYLFYIKSMRNSTENLLNESGWKLI